MPGFGWECRGPALACQWRTSEGEALSLASPAWTVAAARIARKGERRAVVAASSPGIGPENAEHSIEHKTQGLGAVGAGLA